MILTLGCMASSPLYWEMTISFLLLLQTVARRRIRRKVKSSPKKKALPAKKKPAQKNKAAPKPEKVTKKKNVVGLLVLWPPEASRLVKTQNTKTQS